MSTSRLGRRNSTTRKAIANNLTSYQGNGGIRLGGLLRRTLIALDRGDLAKLPFSDDVTSESRLLMRRTLSERVQELAPFLTLDPDPYVVVGEDGRTLLADGRLHHLRQLSRTRAATCSAPTASTTSATA